MKVLPSKEQILPMAIVAIATIFIANRVAFLGRLIAPKS